MMDSNELTQLSEEIIQRLGTGADLDGIISNEIFPNSEIYLDETNDGDNEPDDVIILHMDIREPLRALQRLIELKIGVNLKGYSFWLQDVQELEPHKNLVDQCVKGEGLVQINVQIQTIAQRINIMDVLKPTEAALAALGVEETSMETEQQTNTTDDDREIPFESQESDADHEKYDEQSQEKPCLNWVLDSKFKKEQSRLKIPEDPMEWSVSQVKHWFQWAVRQFNLTNVNMMDWVMKGSELCALTHEEFRRKMPKDPGNVFWIHLQLLKECKFVSVIHKAAENNAPNLKLEKLDNNNDNNENNSVPRELKIMRSKGQIQGDGSPTHVTSPNAYGVGSGNNGQVQLWQFLLELLTDREHTSIIQWVGSEGEFKLIDPERVARLWGEKKNKPAMNYEKLSRALRYYYDGDMISKVSGKRFAYKFDCDLKLLIGYNAEELSALVNEKSVVKIATEADFSTKSDKDDDDNSEED